MRSMLALEGATALAALVTLVNEPSGASAIVVLWFLAVVPGALVMRWTKLPSDGAAGWVIIVATSFAIDTLITEAMVYAHVWTPELGLLVLTALCGIGFTREESRIRRVARQFD